MLDIIRRFILASSRLSLLLYGKSMMRIFLLFFLFIGALPAQGAPAWGGGATDDVATISLFNQCRFLKQADVNLVIRNHGLMNIDHIKFSKTDGLTGTAGFMFNDSLQLPGELLIRALDVGPIDGGKRYLGYYELSTNGYGNNYLTFLANVIDVRFDDVLNVRKSGSAKAPIIGAVAHDTKNIIGVGCNDSTEATKWCRIFHQGLSGWVSKRYLKIFSEGDSGPMLIARRPIDFYCSY